MTTGDGSTQSAKLRPGAPHDWAESESDVAETRKETEQELLRQLVAHLRDRRRVLAEDDASAAVAAPATRDPALAIQQPFAATVYLTDDEARHEVQDALNELLSAFDFEVVDSLPPLRGSWYRDFIVLSRRALTSRELGERLQKVERGIELQLLHKQQAEIDSMQGDAVAKLLTALEHTPDALVQIGSVLLVKVDGVPAVRNLTQVELRYLEHNPKLLQSPATILEELQAVDLVDQDS